MISCYLYNLFIIVMAMLNYVASGKPRQLLSGCQDRNPRGGGGEVLTLILVGLCRGKVKNGQGLRDELPVERENVGLRNELESF